MLSIEADFLVWPTLLLVEGGSVRQSVAKVTLRLVALCNLLFAALGVFDINGAISAFPIARKSALAVKSPVPWIDNPVPHLDAVFYTLTAINLAFLIFLALSSFFLWRLTMRGRLMLNLVFGLELLYWLGLPLFNMFLSRWAGDSGALLRVTISFIGTLGNSGISSQLDIAYPIIALIAGNIGYWMLSRS
ncbi:MAG TPA: hypothetical protein VKA02_11575 [Candidatus Acidoferrum sp.]|nr:hypothetical protein [Candidatus Acidoferrum sp.]